MVEAASFACCFRLFPMTEISQVWTNTYHRWFWQENCLSKPGTMWDKAPTFGPFYTLVIGYSYVVMNLALSPVSGEHCARFACSSSGHVDDAGRADPSDSHVLEYFKILDFPGDATLTGLTLGARQWRGIVPLSDV
jgi:hypothetical protein